MEKAIGNQKLRDIQHYNLGYMCGMLSVAVGWRGGGETLLT
jgi:hypothetical protein